MLLYMIPLKIISIVERSRIPSVSHRFKLKLKSLVLQTGNKPAKQWNNGSHQKRIKEEKIFMNSEKNAQKHQISHLLKPSKSGLCKNWPSLMVLFTLSFLFLFSFFFHHLYDTGAATRFNSRGFKAAWTSSWTVRLRRQTSESSSTCPIREFTSAP